jgi:hypothetical protein
VTRGDLYAKELAPPLADLTPAQVRLVDQCIRTGQDGLGLGNTRKKSRRSRLAGDRFIDTVNSEFLNGRFRVCQLAALDHVARSAPAGQKPLSMAMIARALAQSRGQLSNVQQCKNLMSAGSWTFFVERYAERLHSLVQPDLWSRRCGAFRDAVALIHDMMSKAKLTTPAKEPVTQVSSATREPDGSKKRSDSKKSIEATSTNETSEKPPRPEDARLLCDPFPHLCAKVKKLPPREREAVADLHFELLGLSFRERRASDGDPWSPSMKEDEAGAAYRRLKGVAKRALENAQITSEEALCDRAVVLTKHYGRAFLFACCSVRVAWKEMQEAPSTDVAMADKREG